MDMFTKSNGEILSYRSALLWNARNVFSNITNSITGMRSNIAPALSSSAISDDGSVMYGKIAQDIAVGVSLMLLQIPAHITAILPLTLKNIFEQSYYLLEKEAPVINQEFSRIVLKSSPEWHSDGKSLYDARNTVIRAADWLDHVGDNLNTAILNIDTENDTAVDIGIKAITNVALIGLLIPAHAVTHVCSALLHSAAGLIESGVLSVVETDNLDVDSTHNDSLPLLFSEADYANYLRPDLSVNPHLIA